MADRDQPTAGDYVWLAYSIFFFIEPIVRNNTRYWILNALIYALFLAVYIAAVQTRHHTRKLTLIASMALIGLAAFPFNAGASCFLTFSTAILPFTIESSAIIIAAVVVSSLAACAEGLYFHIEWPNYAIAVLMMIIVTTSNIFIAQKKRATDRLLQAQEENQRLAALAERERIARDMHDVLGHTLSVIVLKAELARRLLEPATGIPQPRRRRGRRHRIHRPQGPRRGPQRHHRLPLRGPRRRARTRPPHPPHRRHHPQPRHLPPTLQPSPSPPPRRPSSHSPSAKPSPTSFATPAPPPASCASASPPTASTLSSLKTTAPAPSPARATASAACASASSPSAAASASHSGRAPGPRPGTALLIELPSTLRPRAKS